MLSGSYCFWHGTNYSPLSPMLFFLSILLCLCSVSQAASNTLDPRTYLPNAAPSMEIAAKERFYGKGTWYIPGLGACGSHATGTDYIVAINKLQYRGRVCHKHVHIINTTNGKSVRARIQDKCPSCAYGSLDMSPAVFAAISDSGLGEGKLEISWSYASSYSHSRPHSHPYLHSSHSHSHPHSHAYTQTHGHKHKHKHSHDRVSHSRPDCDLGIRSATSGLLTGSGLEQIEV